MKGKKPGILEDTSKKKNLTRTGIGSGEEGGGFKWGQVTKKDADQLSSSLKHQGV